MKPEVVAGDVNGHTYPCVLPPRPFIWLLVWRTWELAMQMIEKSLIQQAALYDSQNVLGVDQVYAIWLGCSKRLYIAEDELKSYSCPIAHRNMSIRRIILGSTRLYEEVPRHQLVPLGLAFGW